MEECVVLDFETANPKRISACSVGGCVIVDGKIVDQFSTFIKPPDDYNYFAPMNVRIHGITPEKVATAPTFDQLFWRFKERVEKRKVLAYSKFDLSVINSLLDYVGRECKFEYIDVCELAKVKIPGLANYKLPTVAKHLGIEDFKHHDATEDALACAKIFLALTTGQIEAVSKEGLPPDDASCCKRSFADSFSGFVSAILEDGVVDYKEAVELKCFLEVSPQLDLIIDLRKRVDEILEDGRVDENESKRLERQLMHVLSELGGAIDVELTDEAALRHLDSISVDIA